MQLTEQPDFDLVARLQAGDEAAFDELMRRYQRPVLNFAWRLLNDAAEADDVAQEVFVRVYQNINSYEPRAKFSTWLFTLARNLCLDRLRSRQRHPTTSLETAADAISNIPDAVAQTSSHELGHEIAAAVAELPEEQRTALVLAEYHGQSYAEIAAVLRCSEKSVESRLYRAKQFLRKRLAFLLE